MQKQLHLILLLILSILTSCTHTRSLDEMIPNNAQSVIVINTPHIYNQLQSDTLAQARLRKLIHVDLLQSGIDLKSNTYGYTYSRSENDQVFVVLTPLVEPTKMKTCIEQCNNATLQWKKCTLGEYTHTNSGVYIVSKNIGYFITGSKLHTDEDLIAELIPNKNTTSLTANPSFAAFLPQVTHFGMWGDLSATENFPSLGNPYITILRSQFDLKGSYSSLFAHTEGHTLDIDINNQFSPHLKEGIAAINYFNSNFKMDAAQYISKDELVVASLSIDPQKTYNILLNILAGGKSNVQSIQSTIDLFLMLQGTSVKNILSSLSGNIMIVGNAAFDEEFSSSTTPTIRGDFALMFELNPNTTFPDLSNLLSVATPNAPVDMWIDGQTLFLCFGNRFPRALKNKEIPTSSILNDSFYTTMKHSPVAMRYNKSTDLINFLKSRYKNNELIENIQSLEYEMASPDTMHVQLTTTPNISALEALFLLNSL